MPLLFAQLCDLLSTLEDLSRRDPPLLPARLRQRYNEIIKAWFTNHPVSINSLDVDAVALLSTLFPAKRTDRVYNIQLKRLTKLLKRCLCLGKDRVAILDQWQTPGRGNLGDCVERALQQAEFPKTLTKDSVTVNQIDAVLASIAKQCRFSGPKVRQREVEDDQEVLRMLSNTYQRMQSREAKWFTRLILKDFSCLGLAETMVYHYIDPRLRVAMQMYDEFEAAITELRALPASQMIDSGQGGWTQQCANDAHLLPPKIGVKLGPPKWVKAKGGVKHAVSVIDGRTMSVERKHDGEYCQIHVDLSRGENCIQIFSKSGKDSTTDRIGVHQAIKDGLRIGRDDCGFSEKCILEGELLVWSEKTKEILEFHKIRKHVSRSGSFLGTDMDSQPHPWEKLLIVFYDVMLIDDDPVLHRTYRERRRLLEKLVKPIRGRVGILWQKHVSFSTPDGARRLKQALAQAFVMRWEGLVLKPSDEPYFNLERSSNGRYPSRWIKLKKDCIKGLGDSADFAVLGAGYDVREAGKYPDLDLSWTHFYIGCLRNKDAVLHSAAKPHIQVFDKISECIKKEDLLYLNQHGQYPLRIMEPGSKDLTDIYDLELASGLPVPKVIFRKPFVFDVAGSGFDKAPNRDIFTLRFPRVLRLHRDRDWKQAVSLDELQAMAVEARTAPTGDLSKEIAEWTEKLDQLDRGADGHLPPWDFTDNEDEEAEVSIGEPSTLATNRSFRRAKEFTAPPLVRMDTGEMKDQEQRLDSGEVVQRPSPQHLMASTTADCSLSTPSNSSPLKQDTHIRQRQMSPPCFARKRILPIIDLEADSRGSKKARPSLIQSKSESNSTVCSNTAACNQPLREITNSARPLAHHRNIEPPQETHLPPDIKSIFVRKLPISLDNNTHSRSKPRRIMEPSSPDRATTASESTTANTTQVADSYNVVSAPPHIVVSAPPHTIEGQQPNNASLPTPPSTAVNPMASEIEQLRRRQVILSPSLADRNHPLHHTLDQHSIRTCQFLDSPTFAATASSRYSIMFLVEPTEEHLNGQYIGSLLRNVRNWHPRSVRVWDWRGVEAMLKGEIADTHEERRKLVNTNHVAKMWWVPEREVVAVRWEDGEIEEVGRDEIRGLASAVIMPDPAREAARGE